MADHQTQLIIAKAWSEGLLELTRVTRRACEIEMIILMLMIVLGELEARPVDISTLAVVTGIPRATVKRKVELLIKKGVVHFERAGARKLVRQIRTNGVWDQIMKYMLDRTVRACAELKKSKLFCIPLAAIHFGYSEYCEQCAVLIQDCI